MRKLKKVLALGLAAAMTFSLVACGGDSTGGNTSSDSGNDAAVSDDGAGGDDSASSGSGSGGSINDITAGSETRTIRIGTWYDHYYDSTMDSIDVNPNVSDPERDQMMFDNLKAVEEKYNVKIEFVNLTWDGIQESINTSILAGKPDCDIYEADLSFAIPAVANGYVQKLDDVIPSDADILNDQNIFAKADAGMDGTYMFTFNSAENLVAGTYMLAFNETMLNDAGLENPNDLYERGEWTWDKYKEYLAALTKDTDGDGVTDVYGFGSRTDFLVDLMLMSNGTQIAGGSTENLSSAEVGECLQFIYDMYNVDHTARPWNPDDFNDNQNAYLEGKVASWITAAWISAPNGNNDSTLGFNEIWCPWPVGPSGNQETNGRKKTSSGNVWFIPTGVEDPAFVYTVFQAWQDWYGDDYELRDNDMTWWEDSALTEENYKVMEYIGGAGNFDLWNALGIEYPWTDLLDGVVTPAQFQESNKQLVQTALDQMYK